MLSAALNLEHTFQDDQSWEQSNYFLRILKDFSDKGWNCRSVEFKQDCLHMIWTEIYQSFFPLCDRILGYDGHPSI